MLSVCRNIFIMTYCIGWLGHILRFFFSSTNIDSVETTIHPAVDNVLVDRKNVILDSTIIQVELVIQAVVVVSIKE